MNPTNITPPPVLFWFKLYAGFMTALYVGCLMLAPVVFFMGIKTTGDDKIVLTLQAVLLGVIGLVPAVACALPFFLPRKPRV